MKQETKVKYQLFVSDLVAKYGDETIISRQDIISVYRKNESKYCHYSFVEKSKDHKVGRNMFIIVEDLSRTIELRDEHIAKIESRKKNALPKSLRDDPVKLAKLVMTPTQKAKKPVEKNEKNSKKDEYNDNSIVTFDEIDEVFGGFDDIQNIMKTMN